MRRGIIMCARILFFKTDISSKNLRNILHRVIHAIRFLDISPQLNHGHQHRVSS